MSSSELSTSRVIGLIPARWASQRFPGKPLHPIAGKALIQHVWERVRTCSELDAIALATDDDRIAECARGFGARVVRTSPDHPSGTDRIAEAAEILARGGRNFTHIINIQGDEPLIESELIDELARRLKCDPGLEMITAANPITPQDEIDDPNIVKVVLDARGFALYFSRCPIPHQRDPGDGPLPVYRHKGIYGFRRDFLSRFIAWPPSPLEKTEHLEQLRALENGTRISVVITDDRSIGVDTPDQVAIIEHQLRAATDHPPAPDPA